MCQFNGSVDTEMCTVHVRTRWSFCFILSSLKFNRNRMPEVFMYLGFYYYYYYCFLLLVFFFSVAGGGFWGFVGFFFILLLFFVARLLLHAVNDFAGVSAK